MERLAFPSSSKTSLLDPRLFLHPRISPSSYSTPRARLPSLPSPRHASFLLKQGAPPTFEPCRPRFPSSLLRRFSVRCSESPVCPHTGDSGGVLEGRRSDAFTKKVASAGLLALLSIVSLTLMQPILAPPVYAAFQSSAAATGGRLARTELLSSAWTGFFAGCLHTLSGPDHLAALAPLSIGRTRTESAIVGALWGCGHDAGQLIFGLLFLLLKDRLHIEVIRTWGTRVVGMTLVVIGALGIKEAQEVPTPCVVLENGECDVGMIDSLESVPSGKKKIGFATFATGIVHGLQPDAMFMILPALALPSRVAGALFLSMFLVGTVLAMGSYTVFIGSCSQALKDRIPRVTEKLTLGASLIAICMGVAILVSQIFGFSLY